MDPVLAVMLTVRIAAAAQALGNDLRSRAQANLVGQSAGFLLRDAYELYDRLAGDELAARELRGLIARNLPERPAKARAQRAG